MHAGPKPWETAIGFLVAVSPERFLARQGFYLYDLRKGLLSHRVDNRCQSNIVSDISFHPKFPQLAVSSNDGFVRFFRD